MTRKRTLALVLTAALVGLATAQAAPPSPSAPAPAPAPGVPPAGPGEAGNPGAAPARATGPAPAAAEPLPIDELRAFTEVFARIKADYVDEVSDRQLLESALKGMLAGLDPHSAYLDPEAFRGLQEGTTGEFGGVGIEVAVEAGTIRVISPVDDTPAARAGIRPGDLILRIDDTPTKDMTLIDAVKLLRGAPGSEVRLTLGRGGVEKPIEVLLRRDLIRTRSVRSEMLEPGFAYVRVSNFQNHTGEDLKRALKELQATPGGIKGLVLDLRNNPGGVLNAAVEVSDHFLERGRIVYTDGRVVDATLQFDAQPGDLLRGAPVVVLINAGSASASEIVAGALQDHRRGVIMGSQSFGKGSVQTILPMQNQSALKLTTARYYTPSGRSIQAQGIVPDIILEDLVLAEAPKTAEGLRVREADLRGRLANPAGEGAEGAGSPPTPAAAPAPGDGKDDAAAPITPTDPAATGAAPKLRARDDYAINEALNLLKGMALLKAPPPARTATPSAPSAGKPPGA
jgi:carboxyl-terminal processing protease